MNDDVVWEQKFLNKLVSKVKSICNGTDINYLKSTDEFLFILPKQVPLFSEETESIDQWSKIIISYDIGILPNGNFIYARGFVNKGVNRFDNGNI